MSTSSQLRPAVDLHYVIFAAVLTFLAAWMLVGSSAADAHSASARYPKKWSADPTYAFGDLDSPLNTSTAKSSLHFGDNPWDAVSGNWLDFGWSGITDSSVVWLGGACSTAPSNRMWIMTYNLSSLATSNLCTSGSSILRSTIRVDDVGRVWHTSSSSSIASNARDLRSVIVHEFGHAEGFLGHFTEPDADCTGSNRQTMCQGLPKGTIYKRTLQGHDKHTVKSAY